MNDTHLQLEASPWRDLCFRGDKVVLVESRRSESESLRHTLCYHSQMDDVCAGRGVPKEGLWGVSYPPLFAEAVGNFMPCR